MRYFSVLDRCVLRQLTRINEKLVRWDLERKKAPGIWTILSQDMIMACNILCNEVKRIALR